MRQEKAKKSEKTLSAHRLGAFGERVAGLHLQAKGYRILGRNIRMSDGELDLVALKDDTVIVVEVRTRRGRSAGLPEESISMQKAQRLFALAQAYLATHPELPAAARIDLIAVEIASDGRVQRVQHLEDIVTGT